jgi:hypothetical protein
MLCAQIQYKTRRSDNHFLINKGNLQFDFFKPEEVTKWVTWLEDCHSSRRRYQRP